MIQSSIAPGLLLAMPQLSDPNFARSVVLMVEHNDQGSFGLVINQPLDVPARELFASLDISWNGDVDQPLWLGGPVQTSSGWILHEPVDALPAVGEGFGGGATIAVCPGLSLSTSQEALRTLAEQPPGRLRMILGYSGWAPGQLAAEMAHGSWLHADVDLEIVFESPADEMWERALATLGIQPQTIIQGSGIH